MVLFHSVLYVYQRVNPFNGWLPILRWIFLSINRLGTSGTWWAYGQGSICSRLRMRPPSTLLDTKSQWWSNEKPLRKPKKCLITDLYNYFRCIIMNIWSYFRLRCQKWCASHFFSKTHRFFMAWDLEVTWVLRCPKGIDPHQHSKGFQTASTFMPGAGRGELDTHFPQKKGVRGTWWWKPHAL